MGSTRRGVLVAALAGGGGAFLKFAPTLRSDSDDVQGEPIDVEPESMVLQTFVIEDAGRFRYTLDVEGGPVDAWVTADQGSLERVGSCGLTADAGEQDRATCRLDAGDYAMVLRSRGEKATVWLDARIGD